MVIRTISATVKIMGFGRSNCGIFIWRQFRLRKRFGRMSWVEIRRFDAATILPLENVSYDEITRSGGFFERLNEGEIRSRLANEASMETGQFRLPSETEWEYAARGGPNWRDGFRFSGSNEVDLVAWHDRRHGDHTMEVGRKRPNQLGIFDMSGNVWEWCQDVYREGIGHVPADGRAVQSGGDERVLRGGCFHNWAVHCTVSKRYEIDRKFHDGCIGIRPVLAAAQADLNEN